jgi:hypothetical protein
MNYFRKQDQAYLSLAGSDLELSADKFRESILDTIPFKEISRLNLAIQEENDMSVVSFAVVMNLTHFLRQRNVDVHFKAPRNLYSILRKLNLNTAFASFTQAD